MQCRLPRNSKKLIFDVVISGDLSVTASAYVTVNGTKYTTAQTCVVTKDTNVTVFCSSAFPSYRDGERITLNNVEVARGTEEAGAEYTFPVTDNCSIVIEQFGGYYKAAITMPA